jgi:DNA repair protein RadC
MKNYNTASTLQLLRETPITEQPLARLEKSGPAALSLAELLQIALDGKSDPLLPLRLLNRWDSLVALGHASPHELRQIPGMTRLRVARLQAVLELARRAQTTEPS